MTAAMFSGLEESRRLKCPAPPQDRAGWTGSGGHQMDTTCQMFSLTKSERLQTEIPVESPAKWREGQVFSVEYKSDEIKSAFLQVSDTL